MLKLFQRAIYILLRVKCENYRYKQDMEINLELENKLWSISNETNLDKATCNEIIDYLLARLSDYLKTPLKLSEENWLEGNSFNSEFEGILQPNIFHISFVGTLGMQIINEKLGASISTWLFLFGNHFRLTAGQSNRSYIYFEYKRKEERYGEWESFGWQIDEFDEFDNVIEGNYEH